MILKLKFYKADGGSFRTYYKEQSKGGLFCLQPKSCLTLPEFKKTGELDLFLCSKDGEPIHTVKKENFIMEV